jgi:hypothetical protein
MSFTRLSETLLFGFFKEMIYSLNIIESGGKHPKPTLKEEKV